MFALIKWLVGVLVVGALFATSTNAEVGVATVVTFVVGAGFGWTLAVMTASYRSWMSNRRRWWMGKL